MTEFLGSSRSEVKSLIVLSARANFSQSIDRGLIESASGLTGTRLLALRLAREANQKLIK
jgi:pilus assembly protein TadC